MPKTVGERARAAGRKVSLVVITGHSGAGKSEAIAAFEDGGYFCVDNLPPRMIGSLGELFRHDGSGVERAAVVSDVRGGDYFDELIQVLDELEADGLSPASSSSRRTRRPWSTATRRRAAAIRSLPRAASSTASAPSASCWRRCAQRADVVMDTSDLTGGMLRRRIAEEMLGERWRRQARADAADLRLQERAPA